MSVDDEVSGAVLQLSSPVGDRGSGAARYAAAMTLYEAGRMSPQLLEIYRRCCKFDHEDPVDLAKYEGLSAEVAP